MFDNILIFYITFWGVHSYYLKKINQEIGVWIWYLLTVIISGMMVNVSQMATGREAKLWFVAFINFHGINILTIANVKYQYDTNDLTKFLIN